MSNERRFTGFLGEELAALYLKKNGYEILRRNFRCPLGEIDIIAKDSDVLVFIEVRSKKSTFFGVPMESICRRKIRHIVRVAHFYIKYAGLSYSKKFRFDVVSVSFNQAKAKITIVKNAFWINDSGGGSHDGKG